MGMGFKVNGQKMSVVAVALAVFSSTGGFIFGYDTGQISDFLEMDDFLLRFADGMSIGTLFGALAGASVADALGRKKGIMVSSAIVIVGTIIQVTTMDAWEQFMIGRLVTGLGVGGLSAQVPLFQSETAPKEIRGSLVATYQLFITFGILVAYCICIGTRDISPPHASASWRIVVALNILWALVLGVGIMFAPESPRWLVKHGHVDKAEHALARVRGVRVEDNDFSVKESLVEIQEHVRKEAQMPDATWADCFRTENKVLYRTLLGMTLQALQQLTGANYYLYYGASLFQSVGLEDSFVTQIILGAVNFVSTFGGIYIMERFGRRKPLIIGALWQSLWLIVYASAGTANDPTISGDKGIGNAMIVAACLFFVGYATTWAPGIWILIGETFPNRTRAKQGALSTASNWLFNFLLAFFTSFIVGAIKFRFGYVFAASNLAGAVFVYFFLYESSNLSLEAVDDMYNAPDVKPWTSSAWVPSGHESRQDFSRALEAERKAEIAKKVDHRELADPRPSEDTFVGTSGGDGKRKAIVQK